MGHSEPAGFDHPHLYPWGTCTEQGTTAAETLKLCPGKDRRALTREASTGSQGSGHGPKLLEHKKHLDNALR